MTTLSAQLQERNERAHDEIAVLRAERDQWIRWQREHLASEVRWRYLAERYDSIAESLLIEIEDGRITPEQIGETLRLAREEARPLMSQIPEKAMRDARTSAEQMSQRYSELPLAARSTLAYVMEKE